MRKWLHKSSLVMLGMALCATGLAGCSTSDDATDPFSIIQGNVAQVAVALQESSSDSRFATLKELFTLVRTAHAQSSNVEGIIIEALLNGQVIDTAITDGAGNFVLTVVAGTITLSFEVDGVTITVEVLVPLQTVVTLSVSIDVPEEKVEVEQLDYEVDGAIHCTNEDIVIPEGGMFEIKSDGDACIFAVGHCSVEINATHVSLSGCDQCIRALGSGSVSLTASEKIECEATETGLLAGGNATVSMRALGDSEAGGEAGTETVNSLNLGLPDQPDKAEETEEEAEEEVEDGGEIKIVAPTAIELQGTADVRVEARRIEFESIDHAIDVTGSSGLFVQARVRERGEAQSTTVQTRVEDMEAEHEDESGVIQLTSIEGSAVATSGNADVSLVADTKVVLSSSESAVDAGGKSSVEIGVGTGAGDGIETPDSGDADIASNNAFGVDASGSASVLVVANGDCSVSGASGDVNDDSNGAVSVCE